MDYEKRSLFLKDIKLRAETDSAGKKILIGTIPYNSEGEDLSGWYKEVITKTAFNQSLNSNRKIFALKNHNPDFPLGNTESGTLSLRSTDKGLECRCELPATQTASELFVSVERGDASGMSFGFIPIKSDEKDGVVYLREVKLLEVSFGVVFPFYPQAQAETDVRGQIKKISHLLYKREKTMDKETLEALKALIQNLQKIVDDSEGNAESNSEPDSAKATATADQPPKKEEAKEVEKTEEEKKKEEEKELEEKQARTALLLKLDLISQE